MNHFITLKDITTRDLRKIIGDAKKRKNKRKKFSTLELDKDKPLKGKLLIQMFEKSSLRTRLSFYLAIKQLGGGTITIRAAENVIRILPPLNVKKKEIDLALKAIKKVCLTQK